MLIHGQCHCGNIAFSLTWDPDPKEIQARVCDCTFCQKHGGVWASNPRGALQVKVKDAAAVSRYAFASETAQFHICARCGVVPVVSCTLDGRVYAVVNVNAFDNIDRSIVRRAPITFEGEAIGSRLERRKRNWIGAVTFR